MDVELGLRRVEVGGRMAAPGQGGVGRLPLCQGRAAVAACPDGAETEGGRHGDHGVTDGWLDRHGLVAVPVVVPHAGLHPVLEDGHDVGHDLDVPLDAGGQPQQGPRGGGVAGRPAVVGSPRHVGDGLNDEQVLHQQPASRGVPRRLEHHGPGDVAPVMGHLGAHGPEPEVSGRAVEEGAEHAGGVRPRQAQPLHCAVRGHETVVHAVREESVVGDRGNASVWPAAASSVTALIVGNQGAAL